MSLATDIATLDADTAILHAILHGTPTQSVATEGGTVPTIAKRLMDLGTGTVRGAWLTATAYGLNELASNGGLWYRCSVAHTSGTFATDLAAFKWIVAASPVDARLSLTSVAATLPDASGAVISATATDANFAGYGLYANMTGLHWNGVALGVDAAATDGASPYLMRMRYNGADQFTMVPTRSNLASQNVAAMTVKYDYQSDITAASTYFQIYSDLRVAAGKTNSGEHLASYIQHNRNISQMGDSGTLNSMKGLQISIGHDLIDAAATPTTNQVTAIYLRLKANTGTIGNMFGLRFAYQGPVPVSTHISGGLWGVFADDNRINHAFSGKTVFGAYGTPAEVIDVQSGNLRILGTLGNTVQYANPVATGAVAVALGSTGPAGVSTNPQWWLRVNINGTYNAIIPAWQYNS